MNKNSKLLRKNIRKASKRGIIAIEWKTPVRNFHSVIGSYPNDYFTTKTFPCAIKDKNGVISKNVSKNLQMKVLHNALGNGNKDSLTTHISIFDDRPIQFRNHNYIENYFQPKNIKG